MEDDQHRAETYGAMKAEETRLAVERDNHFENRDNALAIVISELLLRLAAKGVFSAEEATGMLEALANEMQTKSANLGLSAGSGPAIVEFIRQNVGGALGMKRSDS